MTGTRTRRPIRSRLAGLAATGVAVAGLSVGMTAQPAAAAWGDWGYTSGGNVRACPGTYCVPVAWAQPGWLQVYCWTDSQWVNGSPRWFFAGRYNEYGGYMHSSIIPVQPSVPHC